MGSKFPLPWCRKGGALILVFLFIIFSPIIFSIVLNLWVIRWFLSLVKKYFKPQLGQFLTGISSVLAHDEAYGNTMCSMTMCISIKGHLSLSEIRRTVQNTLDSFQSEAASSGGGTPKFQKLTQLLTTWMTFSVWENEKDFQVSDHVTIFDREELNLRFEKNSKNLKTTTTAPQSFRLAEDFKILKSDEDVARLAFGLIRIPYKGGRSPWEILVHHGVQISPDTGAASGGGNDTILFCRFHHALADGMSAVLVLSHFVDDKDVFEKTLCTFAPKKVEPIQKILKACRRLCGMYEFICNFLDTWDGHPWNPSPFGTVQFDYHCITFQVPMNSIRKIMREQGQVNFASAIIAVMTAAVRRHFKGHRLKVPDDMHTAVTLGEPIDPTTTGNSFNCTCIKMPTSLNRRDEMIQAVERDYLAKKSADSTGFLLLLMPFLGQLPRFCIPTGSNTSACIATTVPCFEKPTSMAGLPITCVKGVGYAPSANALGIFASVSHDTVSFMIGVSKNIVPSVEDANAIRRYLQAEFVAFQKAGANNFVCPEEVTV